MDKLKKIVLMAIIGLVFPCLSFAMPDIYYYDNYLTGISPFSVSDDLTVDVDGYWEQYNSIQNNYGFVSSYSKEQMTGLPSAVPAYDLDLYIGRDMIVKAGEAVVIYSSTGAQSTNQIEASSNLRFMSLGTTRAGCLQYDSTIAFGSNILVNSDSTISSYSLNWRPNSFSSDNINFNFRAGSINIPMSYSSEYTPYIASVVYLVVNPTDNDEVFRWRNYGGEEIELVGVLYNNISWNILSFSNFDSLNESDSNFIYIIPHIKGNLDVYSTVRPNSDDMVRCGFASFIDIRVLFDFSIEQSFSVSEYITRNLVPASFTFSTTIPSINKLWDLTNIPISNNLAPIFLHQLNATPYIYNKAIYIYDGYININNYEELVALLKENGVGSSDLSKIEALLEEINTGGATGEQVKELINTIQSLENQIFDNMDTESVTNVFDTYKSLLEFGQDLQWLIIANNKMFEIFAGVIMLSAFFIILNRVLR